jgi:hypothetical protein
MWTAWPVGTMKRNYETLDNYAHVLFPPAVPMMPNMIVTCAKCRRGHLSFWRVNRAFGIVKETF